MSHSGIVELLYRLVPLRVVRARLAAHAEKCPACAGFLADRDEVKQVLVAAADLGRLKDIWPAIRAGETADGPGTFKADPHVHYRSARTSARVWGRLAAVGAGISAAVIMTVFTVDYFGAGSIQRNGPAARPGFELHYARIGPNPADTFVVESPEDRMVLIWFESSP